MTAATFAGTLNSDPRLAADILDLARTAAVLPQPKRERLLRLADELLNETNGDSDA